jgi:hypothetical protein
MIEVKRHIKDLWYESDGGTRIAKSYDDDASLSATRVSTSVVKKALNKPFPSGAHRQGEARRDERASQGMVAPDLGAKRGNVARPIDSPHP